MGGWRIASRFGGSPRTCGSTAPAQATPCDTFGTRLMLTDPGSSAERTTAALLGVAVGRGIPPAPPAERRCEVGQLRRALRHVLLEHQLADGRTGRANPPNGVWSSLCASLALPDNGFGHMFSHAVRSPTSADLPVVHTFPPPSSTSRARSAASAACASSTVPRAKATAVSAALLASSASKSAATPMWRRLRGSSSPSAAAVGRFRAASVRRPDVAAGASSTRVWRRSSAAAAAAEPWPAGAVEGLTS